MPRKRTHDEMTATEPVKPQEMSLLQKIRNMWEFASVMQYIYIFGKAVKIDEDFDIEDFEDECLRPGYSEKLEEIGLQLLKWISSHRGLNFDNWDEYTRRQYQAKLPERNIYGDEEQPKKFRQFDIFTKVRILHQLTVWTFWNPDRMRQVMPEDKESEQLDWRINPIGWDEDEREYYVLDDNRLYRRIEPPLPEIPRAKPKYTSKKAQAARRRERVSKRRRRIIESDGETDTAEPEDMVEDSINEEMDTIDIKTEVETDPSKIDTNGGWKWECVATNLQEYQDFLDTTKRSRDTNMKNLREEIISNRLPVIEKEAEKRMRKIEQRKRELMTLEKLATAKRSSRIADKHDRERREAEAAEAERNRVATLAEGKREEERKAKMEMDRQYRMMTREQRIKEREYKRVLMEEQLHRDAEEQKRIDEGDARGSARQIKERIEKSKKELEELEEDDWTFDCSGCGKYGKNFDDGEHSVACEKCNVWQHSKCLGISKSAAEREDFHFICKDCRQKVEDAKRPKISLKFKVGSSSSPPQPTASSPPRAGAQGNLKSPGITPVHLPNHSRPSVTGSVINGQFYPTSALPNLARSPPSVSATNTAHPAAPGYVQRGFGPPPQQGPVADPFSMHNGYPGQMPMPMQSGFYPQSYNVQYPVPVYSQHYPHPNGAHQQHYPRPLLPHQTPVQSSQRPQSSHSQSNGSFSSNQGRLPSPIMNRPTMSPTQGNPDVGPIAGVPGSSPRNPQTTLSPLQSNGLQVSPPNSSSKETPQSHVEHELPHNNSPHLSRAPLQPVSGLSPVKQRTVSPLPPQMSSPFSPPIASRTSGVGFQNPPSLPSARSVSGTPIFPPAEKLAPSPDHMNKSPVPTPSKQPLPVEFDKPGENSTPGSFSSHNGALFPSQSTPTPTPTPAYIGSTTNETSNKHQ